MYDLRRYSFASLLIECTFNCTLFVLFSYFVLFFFLCGTGAGLNRKRRERGRERAESLNSSSFSITNRLRNKFVSSAKYWLVSMWNWLDAFFSSCVQKKSKRNETETGERERESKRNPNRVKICFQFPNFQPAREKKTWDHYIHVNAKHIWAFERRQVETFI